MCTFLCISVLLRVVIESSYELAILEDTGIQIDAVFVLYILQHVSVIVRKFRRKFT
jgi:hypothetical protein